jgi:hypothetical protein
MRDQNRRGALQHFCFFHIHRSCRFLDYLQTGRKIYPANSRVALGAAGSCVERVSAKGRIGKENCPDDLVRLLAL